MYSDKKRREAFLFGLDEMAQGNQHASVGTSRLGIQIGMAEPEISQVGHYLKEERLIDYSNFNFVITHDGREEVKLIMRQTHSLRNGTSFWTPSQT